MEGREGSEGQRHKEEEREGGSGTSEGAQGPLAFWIFLYTGPPEFSYTTAGGLPLRPLPLSRGLCRKKSPIVSKRGLEILQKKCTKFQNILKRNI